MSFRAEKELPRPPQGQEREASRHIFFCGEAHLLCQTERRGEGPKKGKDILSAERTPFPPKSTLFILRRRRMP